MQNLMILDMASLGLALPNQIICGMACFGLKGRPYHNSIGFALQNPMIFDMAPLGVALPNPMNCGVACFGLKGKPC